MIDKRFDISNFVDVITESSIVESLVKRVKARRKEAKLSQKELAVRSAVSYASIKRFEQSGEISLSSLVKIASALDCLTDFNYLFKNKIISNLKDYKW